MSSSLLIICILVRVAFLTLLERKDLGYIQVGKGPNKVDMVGLIQPFRYAIKLFTKKQNYPLVSNFNLYYFSPVETLLVFIFVNIKSLCYHISWLIFKFNYALLGRLRSVAQTVPYEFLYGWLLDWLRQIVLPLILRRGS
nr:unnamed protein product [Callosobruchus chinensis]